MTEFMTEQEQVEQLKNWIKQYGMTIVAGVVLAFILVTCWDYWNRYQTKILTQASRTYDELLTLRAQNNTPGTLTQAKKLINTYPKTPYAQLAALMLARDATVGKNYPEAITQLTWVIDHSNNKAMRQIAKTRIARIDLTQNKPDQALNILATVDEQSFNGLVDEIRGDAYLQQKNNAKAKEFYALALKELPQEIVTQTPVLQMKLDNLASANDAT